MDREDQGTPEHDPDDDWSPDPDHDGVGLRGWISPDDRLWRHPSESAARADGIPPPGAGVGFSQRPRPVPWVVGGATVCFVLVLVAAGVMIATAGEPDHVSSPTLQSMMAPQAPTTEAAVGHLPSTAAVKALIGQISPSLVAVVSTGASGTTESAGLVVSSGVIVTTAPKVATARSLTVVEYNGTRRPGTVIGTDRPSGLTLVSIADDLPAATQGNSDPAAGSLAMAMALQPARDGGAVPTMSVYAGRVVSTGRTVTADKETATFTSTAVTAPLARDDIGCPLVDAQGHVTGLLEAVTGSDGSVLSVFLPAQLVFAVADQLLTSGAVDHGSLGVQATDAQATVMTATTTVGGNGASGAVGARVVSVATDGPAADAGLAAGDVITAVGGAPVHSLAELETRLYADPPGTAVSLTIDRGGATGLVRPVTLGTRTADASAVSASP